MPQPSLPPCFDNLSEPISLRMTGKSGDVFSLASCIMSRRYLALPLRSPPYASVLLLKTLERSSQARYPFAPCIITPSKPASMILLAASPYSATSSSRSGTVIILACLGIEVDQPLKGWGIPDGDAGSTSSMLPWWLLICITAFAPPA